MRIIFLILTVGVLFSSCTTKDRNKGASDFSFYLPEAELYITTSKRVGGDFYLIFSKTDSVSVLSDSIDYIHCQVEDDALVIVLDPKNKNKIHFMYPYVKKINKKNLDIIELEPDDFTYKFYHPGVMTSPDTLRNPYKALFVAPMSYLITFQQDSIFGHQIRIKEGDMWGR